MPLTLCRSCKESMSCYKTINKTNAKKQYMLTDNELESLKSVRKKFWGGFYTILFLEKNVKEFAAQKWGTSFDDEKQKRNDRLEKFRFNRKLRENERRLNLITEFFSKKKLPLPDWDSKAIQNYISNSIQIPLPSLFNELINESQDAGAKKCAELYRNFLDRLDSDSESEDIDIDDIELDESDDEAKPPEEKKMRKRANSDICKSKSEINESPLKRSKWCNKNEKSSKRSMKRAYSESTVAEVKKEEEKKDMICTHTSKKQRKSDNIKTEKIDIDIKEKEEDNKCSEKSNNTNTNKHIPKSKKSKKEKKVKREKKDYSSSEEDY